MLIERFNELLASRESLKGQDIRASVIEGDVIYLQGSVKTYEQVVEAGFLAAGVVEARNVVNDLTYDGDIREKKDRSADIAKSRQRGVIADADIVVVGGGIIGCGVARQLSKYPLKILVIEKCPDIGEGNTKSNNGMVHSGYDSKHGTLKAKLNVEGNAKYDRWAKELGIAFNRTGSFVGGFSDEDMEHIKAFYENGSKNRVPGIAILSGDEARAIAPALNRNITCALWTPSAGYVEPFEVTLALAENAMDNGVQFMLSTEVLAIDAEGAQIKRVVTDRGVVNTRYVINAAGVYSDDIAGMCDDRFFSVHPRRGTLIIFDKEYKGTLLQYIGTTPSNNTKGGGPTETPEGNPLWGPSAKDVPDKEDYSVDEDDIEFILDKGFRLTEGFSRAGVITYFSGVRAATYKEDFIVEASRKVKGLIHLAGMQSPAVASAPAICDMAEEVFLSIEPLEPKADYNPYHRPPKPFRHMTMEERDAKIKADPRFGHIICRCETVTEGEIVQAIHGRLPAHTLDAVKRRTRAGMGRCQGGFCGMRVLEIIARETGVDKTKVSVRGGATQVLMKPSRDGGDGV